MVVLAIDPKAGAVILAHSVDRGWIVDCLRVVFPRLFAHLLPHPVAVIPSVRVGVDNALGLCGWVAHEEPVPPLGGEPRVAPSQCFPDRNTVDHRQVRDGCGVVQCQAEGHIAATVVSCHGEPVMTESTHQ